MRLQLERQEHLLDKLFESIRNIQDDELKAHMAKYFCIRISGYLENVIKILVLNYAEGSSPKPISNFLNEDLKSITNLSKEKLERLLKKFSNDWLQDFQSRVTERQMESLNSIISNRNSIAHGQQDSISYRVIEQYYNDLKEVINILKSIIKRKYSK